MDFVENRNRIARWLRGVWSAAEEADTPDRLALRHVSVSDRQIDVATFALPVKEVETFDVDGLLSRIEEAVENDVEGLGGVQKYVLHALREGRPVSRLPLRAAASKDEVAAPEALETEPASAKGLLGQLMRHNEVQSRLLAMSIGQNVSTMQRTIARLQDANERAEDKLLAAIEISEELLTRDHERKAMTQMVEDNRAVQGVLIEGIKNALPHLLRFVAGGASNPTGVGAILKKLHQSLRPEQVEALAKILTPAQLELLQELFGSQGFDEEAGAEEAEDSPAPAEAPATKRSSGSKRPPESEEER